MQTMLLDLNNSLVQESALESAMLFMYINIFVIFYMKRKQWDQKFLILFGVQHLWLFVSIQTDDLGIVILICFYSIKQLRANNVHVCKLLYK